MADTPERRPTDVAPTAERANRPAITSEDVDRSQARSAGGSATEETRRQASRLAEEARQRGKSMLDQQKGNAVNQLSGLASALRQTASQCQEREDQRTTGRALEQAANGLERIADALRSRDVDTLMEQAADLMRRQPAIFIGGTIAAGFLLSRFAKSSAQRPHGASYRGAGRSYDEEAYSGTEAYNPDAGASAGEGRSYVTSAHVNPGEVTAGRPGVPPVTPTGRRDF